MNVFYRISVSFWNNVFLYVYAATEVHSHHFTGTHDWHSFNFNCVYTAFHAVYLTFQLHYLRTYFLLLRRRRSWDSSNVGYAWLIYRNVASSLKRWLHHWNLWSLKLESIYLLEETLFDSLVLSLVCFSFNFLLPQGRRLRLIHGQAKVYFVLTVGYVRGHLRQGRKSFESRLFIANNL